ncbi:alkylhydroperoxidase AhpD family core domain-containing protein [Modestobacter sp. DSM 44400]|uniref:carboxymuconolactone decarboxylase family protein n=1 Tax=Modestobacter sp. DSM 44400 TaxID=1550230 RepID=UPI00089A7BA0|nr:carboxymuconolactone decarboxylase family protein [Modestobacter sp. DSM 44400]SDX99080.1 alkylhydroperoxidase AhpD family core domain-containing protein [Modestobacter sp. DSM 44400]
MPRIPVHTVADAPENSRDELKALEVQFGKVLNIHGEMAHAPVVLAGYVALQQVIGDYGTFGAATREAIALVVGNVDRCSYCQSAHTLGAKRAGLTEEQTVAIREGRVDFDPKLAALLTLVRASSSNLGHVSDEVWQAALDAGWSDTELTEVSLHIALNLFTNHFNHLVETDLDLPPAPGL